MGRKAGGRGPEEGAERRDPKVGRSTQRALSACMGTGGLRTMGKDNLGQGYPKRIPFVFCKDSPGKWIS